MQIHELENNKESQDYLDENRKRLSNQCEYLLSWFLAGGTMTVREALVDHNIMSLPRRVKDLTDAGYPIMDGWIWIRGKRSHKVYYYRWV